MYPDVYSNILRLISSGNGTVVANYESAQKLKKIPVFKNEIKIQNMPLKSKSYFILFSKKSAKLNTYERKTIWNQIKKLRCDKKFMAKLDKEYKIQKHIPKQNISKLYEKLGKVVAQEWDSKESNFKDISKIKNEILKLKAAQIKQKKNN